MLFGDLLALTVNIKACPQIRYLFNACYFVFVLQIKDGILSLKVNI